MAAFEQKILKSELQIREGTEDNSKIILSYFSTKMCCDPSLEMSQ